MSGKQWFPYWKWEDYQAGMYAPDNSLEESVALAGMLLADALRFYEVATQMVQAWPVSAAENLTNKDSNRRSWVGQAACCFDSGASERATRIAWGNLTCEQRSEANRQAERVISEYEGRRRVVHCDVGKPMLRGFGA